MYPVSQVFDWDKWQDGFDKHWRGDEHEAIREEFRTFKRQVLENFKYYRVPVITLDRVNLKGSCLRCLRESKHRRQGAGRFRAGYRDVCRVWPRIAKRLVRR